jgi:hypothetical protein
MVALTINSAVLNGYFGKILLRCRATCTNLAEVRRHTLLHQHQAGLSRILPVRDSRGEGRLS